MYRILIEGARETRSYEELAETFIRPGEFVISNAIVPGDDTFDLAIAEEGDKNRAKRQLYGFLSEKTGKEPKWGILTGVRPVKLFGQRVHDAARAPDHMDADNHAIYDSAFSRMKNDFLVSDEKADLVREIYEYQQSIFGTADHRSCGVYVGIPFCPTRCLYCSFASNPAEPKQIKKYLGAIHREIQECGRMMKDAGWHAESIYIGGGTPTSLDDKDLDELLAHIAEVFMDETGRTAEFTVEAGRPDTVTPGKLRVIKNNGAGRISINPQSMQKKTLERIGRDHSPQDVKKAFEIARDAGIGSINADVIAGLPGEDVEDFSDTVKQVIELGAENITVHSLAVKRASRLKEEDSDYHYKRAIVTEQMLDIAQEKLRSAGYIPYYLYRQKHMAGALENVGYCKTGKAGLYNVRIMDEHQRIIAMGAGAISKAYDPVKRVLSRVPNVTNQEIYTLRVDEMIERKKNNLFNK